MFCARHPNITTVLSCARCEVPICTSCSVPTPVGNRCARCSQSSNYSIFSISTWTIVKAYMTATLLAVLRCVVIVISKFWFSLLEQKMKRSFVSLQIITLEFFFFLDFNKYPTALEILSVVSAVRGSSFTKHLIPSVPNILPIYPFIEYIN